MRPFLSRLRSEVYRLWLLCGAYLFADRSFEFARLPVWSDEVEEFSTRLPLNGKHKGHRIASSGDFQSHPPPRQLILHQHGHDKPIALPPMGGLYNWSSPFSLPHPGSGVLLFTTDSSTDVHVAISPLPQSVNPMYEFVIGGWGNTASVVRRRSQGENLCKVPVGMNKPEVGAENEFWISIDKRTKLVRVGYGREPGFESMFLVYRDPLFLEEARYVCFSTWEELLATYLRRRTRTWWCWLWDECTHSCVFVPLI